MPALLPAVSHPNPPQDTQEDLATSINCIVPGVRQLLPVS